MIAALGRPGAMFHHPPLSIRYVLPGGTDGGAAASSND
jgi:hypothetical protein